MQSGSLVKITWKAVKIFFSKSSKLIKSCQIAKELYDMENPGSISANEAHTGGQYSLSTLHDHYVLQPHTL